MKSSQLRIRVDTALHREFMQVCHQQDIPASQVIRDLMKKYILELGDRRQPDLFVSEQSQGEAAR